MSNNTDGASVTAAFIAVAKWVVVAAIGVFGVATALVVGLGGDSASTTFAAMAFLPVTGFVGVVTYVAFGWFHHTLGSLAQIAANTSR